ncbi:MAG TPA: DUF6252 family protein [Ferruginibacter sp.]|nr:DUF6252 family protein [Ferruginibacter sp.]HMP19820.1 DUF6252 family protein [Ferruginibacter sp.]
MQVKLRSFLYFMLMVFIITSCEKEVSFETGGVPGVVTGGGSAGGTAKYSLQGGSAACSGAVLSGSFTAGTAATAANTVVLKATVDSIGTYSITSGSVNGVSYSGSGTFTATGTQNITLRATGTPLAAGTFNFSTGPGGCTFSVIVNAAPVSSTANFRAKIDGTQWEATRYAQGSRVGGIINISGLGLDKKNITITVQDSGVHKYTLAWDNSSMGAGAFMDSTLADVTAFSSNAGDVPSQGGGELNITAINETSKTMSGTFNFKARRLTDNTFRTISEGVFTNIPYATTLPAGSTKDTFTAKIDGVNFVPTLVIGIKNSILSNIAISGSDASGTKTVAVYFPENITAGNYTLGSMFGSQYGQYNVNSSTFLVSNSGSLEILFHDPAAKRIRGRFSFNAEPFLSSGATAQITEGYFAVTYL